VSAALAKQEIERFLSTSEPEVLCIFGKWGVGKTFAWNTYLKEARTKGSIPVGAYAYVSLFGQGSLSDVRHQIVENTVELKLAQYLDPRKWGKALSNVYSRAQRNLPPNLKGYLSTNPRLLYASVRDQIVCLDDLERKSEEVQLSDVFGLVSELKEQRKCKVVLLLNYDQLGDHRADFDKHTEKVADVLLEFSPSVEEAASIALDRQTAFYDRLNECIQLLEITNIRVIKKIESICKKLQTILSDHDPRIMRQAVHTAALFGAARFQTGDIPSIDWVRSYNTFSFGSREAEAPPEERAWSNLLTEYDFGFCDELDLAISEGVERGYFNSSKILSNATSLQRKLELGDQDRTMSDAWARYHDSFDDNVDEVVEGLTEAFYANYRAVTPLNLNGLARLFKDLGRPEESRTLVEFYVANREEPAAFWNRREYAFGSDLQDEDVVRLFEEKEAQLAGPPADPVHILLRISRESAWGPRDIETLSHLSADDFFTMFKNTRGQDLRRIVVESLRFLRRGGEDSPERQIGERANTALDRISEESVINSLRVRVKRNNA
jgi:hypothetical protein